MQGLQVFCNRADTTLLSNMYFKIVLFLVQNFEQIMKMFTKLLHKIWGVK